MTHAVQGDAERDEVAGARRWRWYDVAPSLLLGLASVALLLLVVVTALGWLF